MHGAEGISYRDAQDTRDGQDVLAGECQKQDLRDFMIWQDWERFIM